MEAPLIAVRNCRGPSKLCFDGPPSGNPNAIKSRKERGGLLHAVQQIKCWRGPRAAKAGMGVRSRDTTYPKQAGHDAMDSILESGDCVAKKKSGTIEPALGDANHESDAALVYVVASRGGGCNGDPEKLRWPKRWIRSGSRLGNWRGARRRRICKAAPGRRRLQQSRAAELQVREDGEEGLEDEDDEDTQMEFAGHNMRGWGAVVRAGPLAVGPRAEHASP